MPDLLAVEVNARLQLTHPSEAAQVSQIDFAVILASGTPGFLLTLEEKSEVGIAPQFADDVDRKSVV